MLARICFVIAAVLFVLLGFKVITHDSFQWEMISAAFVAGGLALTGVVVGDWHRRV